MILLKQFKTTDSNKAHDHYMISIRMLKICGESISKHLERIFKSCVEKYQFPNVWYEANVVQVHKKVMKCQETTDLFYYFQYKEKHLNI